MLEQSAAVVPVKHGGDQGPAQRPSLVRADKSAAVCDEQTAAKNAKKPRLMLAGRVAHKVASVDGVMPPSDDDENGHDGDDEVR